ncbi:hypothetical protein P153DRAFT_394963 [Dothidotthia symphoricarpi CBS 119687]|uniref:Uncharacterized protein n=1 Tax=Dothidotthia symphoricarpi CBS 119687 TaxID=1392245 RepID=A0A6A6AL91_9PLEO|nr:uncharacterized protein P153DRAFT_394963 [Dothidotthia symphoricarpi CBS 119687]KAF2131647.1 hypothetical protein P153DRAFT_394963 [Dothidotthia symphoricarpi CBS 119687]
MAYFPPPDFQNKSDGTSAEAEDLRSPDPSSEEALDENPTTQDKPKAPKQLQYVRLSPLNARMFTWSNDPDDLSLDTYFNPLKPNLPDEYNIQGLLPVLREPKGAQRFLLRDARDRFYLFDEFEGELWWVKFRPGEETECLEEVWEKCMWILGEVSMCNVCSEAVFWDYNPADDVGKAGYYECGYAFSSMSHGERV